MAFLAWSASLELGLPAIDKQHRQLVDLLNELHDAMRVGRGKDVLGKILASLITYTKTHFADEEAMMARVGYPGLTAHKAEHERLTARVVDAQRRFLAGTELSMSMELMDFLRSWLVMHIQGSDSKVAAHLATRPAAPPPVRPVRA